MPDKKLTDNEIIKALDICSKSTNGCSHSNNTCKDCYLNGQPMCSTVLLQDTLDLINRLQKLKEHYKKCRDKVQDDVMYLAKQCDVLQEEIKCQKAEIENLTKACENQQKISMDRYFEIERLKKFLDMSRKVSLARRDRNLKICELNQKILEELKTAKAKALNEAASKFAGHSDYHGDTILCTLYCMAEGKEVGNAKPLDTSKIKAEAYKECIEKVKEELKNIAKIDFQGSYYYLVGQAFFDNLLEKMVGENNV